MNIFRYAWQNILRNISLSISSVLVITLLIFFVNILLFVLYASDNFVNYINNRIVISISLKPGYTNEQVRTQDFIQGLQTSFSGASVLYRTKEENLEILSSRAESLTSIVENRDENPLPNQVEIRDVKIADYEYLDTYISQHRDILQYDKGNTSQKLLDYKAQYEQIVVVVEMMQKLNSFIITLIGLFLATVFLVVYVIIRNFIHHFRNEISIIELVGGYSVFIYGPFVVQGIFYTFLGVLFALCIFYCLRFFIAFSQFPLWYESFFKNFYPYFFEFYCVPQFLLAISIGIFSALFASYRYMDSTIRGK